MEKRQNLILGIAVAIFSLFSVALSAQCGTFDESPKGEDGLVAHQLYRDAVKAKDLEAMVKTIYIMLMGVKY